MRKFFVVIGFMCAATFVLGGCNKEQAQEQAANAQPEVVSMPTNATDKAAWKKYLVSVVMQNMQGVKTTRPYVYFVPTGDDEAAQADRDNQLSNVQTVVARGVVPGNMLAFGGPDSATTADLIIESFASANEGSFKDVVVLFVGSPADQQRVADALAPSAADYRFVEMK
jgi:hypothetical protein